MHISRPEQAALAGLLYADLVGLLASIGIHVSVETDFHALSDLTRDEADYTVWPIFDPERSDIGAECGFWLRFHSGGRTVGAQAVRLWQLDTLTLGDHMRRHLRLYCAPNHGLDLESAEFNGRGWDLSGRLAYHGQLWLAPDFKGKRVADFPVGRMVLPRLAHALLMMSYPDLSGVFGLCPDATTEKGIIASYGFPNQGMPALKLYNRDGSFAWYETLLTVDREELYLEFQRMRDRLFKDKVVRHPAPEGTGTRPSVALVARSSGDSPGEPHRVASRAAP